MLLVKYASFFVNWAWLLLLRNAGILLTVVGRNFVDGGCDRIHWPEENYGHGVRYLRRDNNNAVDAMHHEPHSFDSHLIHLEGCHLGSVPGRLCLHTRGVSDTSSVGWSRRLQHDGQIGCHGHSFRSSGANLVNIYSF